MIRARPLFFILIAIFLAGFVLNQIAYRMEYGSCMFRYVLPGCDYASYTRASGEILNGQSPYYENTNYIYTPPLAILMIPFTWVSEKTGFTLWTILNVLAFGYGTYRTVTRGRSA